MIHTLKEYARDLALPPQYEASNPVERRGEPLDAIYWQGRQWAVTAFGLEKRDGTYAIDKDRIWENEDAHGWVGHMSKKRWVDLEDFAEALRVARRQWPKLPAPSHTRH